MDSCGTGSRQRSPGIDPKRFLEIILENLKKIYLKLTEYPLMPRVEDSPLYKDLHKEMDSSKCSTTVDHDPRFQQQNQTIRCFIMYTDYHRCRKILGEKHEACPYFKYVYEAVCPLSWIEDWDEKFKKDRRLIPWHKGRSQGYFPGCFYGTYGKR